MWNRWRRAFYLRRCDVRRRTRTGVRLFFRLGLRFRPRSGCVWEDGASVLGVCIGGRVFRPHGGGTRPSRRVLRLTGGGSYPRSARADPECVGGGFRLQSCGGVVCESPAERRRSPLSLAVTAQRDRILRRLARVLMNRPLRASLYEENGSAPGRGLNLPPRSPVM